MPVLRRNSIPATIAGMLFFLTSSAQIPAPELFREGQWALCLRECQRTEIEQGVNTPPRIKLLEICCRSRLSQVEKEAIISQLAPLIAQTNDLETAAIASFERGRLLWMQNSDQGALNDFAFAFQTTTNHSLFLQSACSAFLVLSENPSFKTNCPGLLQQINTSRALWTGELFGLCRQDKKPSKLRIAPADWVIRFYRSQISPAIGQRCTLEPSCSEYFRIASERNSLLSIPQIADRLIREPTVNNQKKEPVFIRGMLRYKDPLDDHDFWMK